jgi:flagellar basal-body rod protein FlgB
LASSLQEVGQDYEGFHMSKIADHLGIHQHALQLRAQRNEILASNIANASTPNFKARDLDFLSELEKHQPGEAMLSSNQQHMNSLPTTSGPVQYRLPTAESLDGNTVELHVEQMQFAENVMKYQASLNFLNNKITGLMSAIKGE